MSCKPFHLTEIMSVKVSKVRLSGLDRRDSSSVSSAYRVMLQQG